MDTLKNFKKAMQSDMLSYVIPDSGGGALYAEHVRRMLPSLMRVMATCSSNASECL